MEYTELTCRFENDPLINDILIAELAELGFESFVEDREGLKAYIPSNSFSPGLIENIHLPGSLMRKILFSHEMIPDKNWNEAWESGFDPVIFPGKCAVIAPFHDKVKDVRFNIIIEPKMSFGTAHHETTAQIIDLLFEFPPENTRVLDMGCGTGVLAILSSLLGAKNVMAIDNDEWAYNNTIENTAKNNRDNIVVYLGDAGLLNTQQFDVVLANINRNVLMHDIPEYCKVLSPGGLLVLSGFYTEDAPALLEVCKHTGLETVKQTEKNKWAALVLKYKARENQLND